MQNQIQSLKHQLQCQNEKIKELEEKTKQISKNGDDE